MSGPMNNDPRTSTEIERDILRAGLRERDEEIARLRAVVAGDPSPRMIRTEDVATELAAERDTLRAEVAVWRERAYADTHAETET